MADDNIFAEKYELIRKLGEGGMAEIYLARQRGLGGFQKELVIKRIHRELTKNERYVELFLDEARIAANLNHPNIVHIYDIGKAYGTYYIAMEFIHGADLMDICRRGIQEKKFLPVKHGVKIISQVAEGLGFAHAYRDPQGLALQIVHRDISPSNIIVSFGGLAKLVDFGIAKAATQIHDDSGKVMGKLNYMAPEQIRGEVVDGRSDLFSLGVVLYEITLGRRLFRGSGDEVARRILEDPIPPPSLARPDYPTDLEVIVMRLLEKKPENRYPDALELHQDLEEFLVEAGARTGKPQISRYLVDLYDLDGVPLEVEEELGAEDDEDALEFDQKGGDFEDDFAEEGGGEVIFASRMPDSFSGSVGNPVSGEHVLPPEDRAHSGSMPAVGRAPSPSLGSIPPAPPPPKPAPPPPVPVVEVAPAAKAEPAPTPAVLAASPAPTAGPADPDAFADLPPLPSGSGASPSAPIIDPFSSPAGLAPVSGGSKTWLWVLLAVVALGGVAALLKVLGVF